MQKTLAALAALAILAAAVPAEAKNGNGGGELQPSSRRWNYCHPTGWRYRCDYAVGSRSGWRHWWNWHGSRSPPPVGSAAGDGD